MGLTTLTPLTEAGRKTQCRLYLLLLTVIQLVRLSGFCATKIAMHAKENAQYLHGRRKYFEDNVPGSQPLKFNLGLKLGHSAA